MASRELSPSTAAATPKSAAPKRPKPARGEAFGILNPWGQFWTYETFGTEEAARAHVAAFWRQAGFEGVRADVSKYTIIPVKVTVTAVGGSGSSSVAAQVEQPIREAQKPSSTEGEET